MQIRPSFPSVNWGSWIWEHWIPDRRSIVVWRSIHGRLATMDVMIKQGVVTAPNYCLHCYKNAESISHLFWDCSFARNIWRHIFEVFQLHVDFSSILDFHGLIVFIMRADFSSQIAKLGKVAVITAVWAIWWSRNRCVFDGKIANYF